MVWKREVVVSIELTAQQRKQKRHGTHEKDLAINLDLGTHGTFAEIGAGQEVARWLFRVGGAAATVANTISAYDMAFSDAIYGPTRQYVSRQRLEAMLDHEYAVLLERLGAKRGATTCLFVFCHTVATRSHSRDEKGQGWIGVRFQHAPLAPPSDIILHLRMSDTEPAREQEALGTLGVNLIYAAFFERHDLPTLIATLMDDLSRERIEVDMIKFSGPSFVEVDNRLMSLQLIEQGLTEAAMFTAEGEVVQAAEVLHKKPVLVERGSFRPVTNTTLDMLERAREKFLKELHDGEAEPVVVMEMSLRNLLARGQVDHTDFLARADMLGTLGKMVVISHYAHHYGLISYLRRHTPEPIVLALGIPNLIELIDEKYYADLDGGLLEGLGHLFKAGVKLYVYPRLAPDSSQVITVETLSVAPHLRHLYAHLMENCFVESIGDVDQRQLHIFPHDVLAKIQGGDSTWEKMVPAAVVEIIKQRRFLGWHTNRDEGSRSDAVRADLKP